MKNLVLVFLIVFLGLGSAFAEVDEFADLEESSDSGVELLSLSGFVDFEQGVRISGAGPAYEGDEDRDYVLANRRLRLKADKSVGKGKVYFMVDFNHDEVADDFVLDIREARFQYTLGKNTDLNIGRQVSTWGVGDLLFINDLFPKNWVAHFSGRDMDMIKDPADSLRLTHYAGSWTLDFVLTPQFSQDTTPSGCKYEIFNPNSSSRVLGQSFCDQSLVLEPEQGLSSSEVAVSIRKKMGVHEVALYGYKGFYKNPRGLSLETLPDSSTALMPYYPELEVYGASFEGQVGPGILSAEVGYYNSKEDEDGDNFLVENSMLKHLVGYRMDLSSKFSLGAQWYRETMMDYKAYESSYQAANPGNYDYRWDEARDTFTLRLGYKAMKETLFINWFSYFRPQDKDSFHKFEILKRLSDEVEMSVGANIFDGDSNYIDRDFGMLKDADNVFVQFKYIF